MFSSVIVFWPDCRTLIPQTTFSSGCTGYLCLAAGTQRQTHLSAMDYYSLDVFLLILLISIT